MSFIAKRYKLILWCIPLISLLLHWHVLNRDLVGYHVWRQTETQTTINNFYRDDFNILHPRYNDHADTNRLHRMEFPIMQWLFALFYKLFGPHIAVTRVSTFIIGLFSVYGIFYLSNNIFRNKAIAVICAWCFNFSPVFYYYTINPMPDNLALCCGIWSLGLFYSYINTSKLGYVIGSALFLSLATLAKLPFIIYGSFILAFMVMSLIRKELSIKRAFSIAAVYALFIMLPAAWYLSVMPGWQIGAVRGVFDLSINHPPLLRVLTGTLVSILPELLVNYGSLLFFLTGLYLIINNKLYTRKYFPVFLCWGTTVILYFLFDMNIIDLVHDYYLFPFLPAIFLLVAYGARYLLTQEGFFKYLAWVCLTILPLTAFLRADSRWDTKAPEFNHAYYAYKQELRSIIPPNALCVVGNDESHYILLYYIDRKGWAFDHDWLDENMLTYYMSKGAGYIFIDSHIDTVSAIKKHLDKKIFEQETLRVYKLK